MGTSAEPLRRGPCGEVDVGVRNPLRGFAIGGRQWTWQRVIPGAWAAGIGALVIYAASLHSWQALGFGLMVSGAAAIVGGLTGFLFGIPRTVTGSGPNDGTTSYQGNTNLEQISDWLTKIIVGIGLVQIARGPDALARLSHSLANGFGSHNANPGFALAMVLYFASTGFLYLYLWSRLDLIRELRGLDLKAVLAPVLADAESKAQHALALVGRALHPSDAGAAVPTQDELNAALADTTDLVRQSARDSAENQRREYWDTNKPVMAYTIPVFRALIAADTVRQDHRSHGSLGFALKDQVTPDWQAALAELTTAIEIRGTPPSEKGWAVYEMNRALCRIHLDAGFNANPPVAANPATAALIIADLAAAAPDTYAGKLLGKPEVKAWFAANGNAAGLDPEWLTRPPVA